MANTSILNSAASHILVVDDEPDLRTLYELTLLREGYRVETAGDLAQAFHALATNRFDAVITDMRLPDGLGLELLRYVAEQQRPERCVVMTAFGSAENAVEALKAGAFDYLTKPVDLKQFRSVVASAMLGSGGVNMPSAGMPSRAPDAKPVAPDALAGPLDGLIGNTLAMRAVKERIVKVSRSMAPVLVRGESGTGKELVARAIHDSSHRAKGPFVAVNCGAIPDNLMEAEFFGAKKGSYTGAVQDRLGYFQAASGGTLFLDEIGDLPLAMQSKLLRAIQERRVRALGSTVEDNLDVRVVSATHKDIGAQVHTGVFRQDLYYRLNVIEIMLPPLRERREDLPALCRALLAHIAQESGLPLPTLAADFLPALERQSFPGNVRELENLLYRAIALSDGEHLSGAMLHEFQIAAPQELAPLAQLAPQAGLPPVAPSTHAEAALDLQAYLDNQERVILVRILGETGYNRTAAAQKLGLTLRQIRYRMQRLGITVPGGDDSTQSTADDAN